MDGDFLKKVKDGDPMEIAAGTYNAFIDATKANRQSQHNIRAQKSGTIKQPELVRVQNTTGAGLTRFSVLVLSTPVVTADQNLLVFQNRPNFKGVTPTGVAGEIVTIIQEPCPDNTIVAGVVAGCSPVQIDVSDESHTFAEAIVDDSTKLASAERGQVRVLWKEPGIGVKWAYVLIGSMQDTDTSTDSFRRFQLITALCSCGVALAERVVYSGGAWVTDGNYFLVHDSIGVAIPPAINACGASGTSSGTSGDGTTSSGVEIGGLTWSNEVPSETPNGSITAFTLMYTPADGAILVLLNGIGQTPTTHYTVSGATVTFTTAPPTGSNVLVFYGREA